MYARRLWSYAWIVAVVVGFAVTMLSASGVAATRVAGFRITFANPWRPLALSAAVAAATLLLALKRRQPVALPLAALVASFIAALLLVSRDVPQIPAFADGAVFELFTRNALTGEQVLGAYSQFGWNHPGPLAFYVFAPFYAAGGASQFALRTGAIAVNILLLGLALEIARRHAHGMLPLMLAAASLLYAMRLPALASSYWNPHLLVISLIALMAVSSAAAAGVQRLWPLVILLASWLVQVHIGVVFAVAVVVLIAGAIGRVSGHTISAGTKWLAGAVIVVVWALPIADQLINVPGNFRRVVHFFLYEGGARPEVGTALKAFAAMTLGVFRPDLYLAQGWLFEPASWWPLPALVVGVALLVFATITEWRGGHRFNAALGSCCLGVIGAGLLSALGIKGPVGDYQLFWLTGVGAVSAAVIASAAAARWRVGSPIVTITAALLFAAAAAISYRALIAEKFPAPTLETAIVSDITTGIMDARHNGHLGELLLEVDPKVWDTAAGVVLELVKREVRVGVDPLLVRLYGPPFRATGRETTLLTIAGPGKHQEVMRQDGRRLLAASNNVFASVREIPAYESYLTAR